MGYNKRTLRIITSILVAGLTLATGLWLFHINKEPDFDTQDGKPHAFSPPKMDPVEKKAGRAEYFHRLLRDPSTGHVPANIRARELNYSRQLQDRNHNLMRSKSKATVPVSIDWAPAGPFDMGGRTRALAIDQRNPDIILAGGVSGGVWKSVDGGASWELKTDPDQNMSVTSLVQDPASPDTWYYSSGERSGNSAIDRGYTAPYYGTGIYKSTNNGDSWSLLSATEDINTSWDNAFDYISRLAVHPTSGDLYVASNGSGIYRSQDGGNSFSLIHGTTGGHYFADVTINTNGDILAVLSELNAGVVPDDPLPGLHLSTDGGTTWVNITPADFPAYHERSYAAFAPSNPDIAYVLTYEGAGSGADEEVSFFKLNTVNNTAEDRSANIPDFGGRVGFMNTQSNYNMVVAVKPDDPDFVLIGGTNLFRSTDGFATRPAGGYDTTNESQKDQYWIGGYATDNNVNQYPHHHPDQHILFFDPVNPDRLWSGHDGGLSVTEDITAAPVSWQDKDEGYITTQFYTIALAAEPGDNRIIGGTQDNGSPFFRLGENSTQLTSSEDVSSGDGSYAHFGNEVAYVSTQNGNVMRLWYDSSGNLTSPYEAPYGVWSNVTPSGAANQLFIHPFAVDPNDEHTMFYPGGTEMWRNTTMDEIPDYNNGGTTVGWKSFTAVNNTNYSISTLELSTSPADILYYGASSNSDPPKIFRLDKARTSTSPQDISISGAPAGAYVHDLAVNPENTDEVIAVISNYNIVGLYHTSDGGETWQAVEGNLKGDASNPGPSLRNATILPAGSSGALYLLGTSTGVYSTQSLNGADTQWTHESPGGIGYAVAEYIVSRPSDGVIAVGTHGRGMFKGNAEQAQEVNFTESVPVTSNWQLIGSPLSSGTASLPDSVQLFGFSGAYHVASELEQSKGYWIKTAGSDNVSFDGSSSTQAVISLNKGWNLISGIATSVPVSNIEDPNNILSSAPVYHYNTSSYAQANTLEPTGGYWIHAEQTGTIQISDSDGDTTTQKLTTADTGDQSHLIFKSGNAVQKLYLSPERLAPGERQAYLMPPLPPEPVMLDVRTNSGLNLADENEVQLDIAYSTFPLQVGINAGASPHTLYQLKSVAGSDTVTYLLSPGETKEIYGRHESFRLSQAAGDEITKYDLYQNFPNPFRNSTAIRYQLADRVHVSLTIYDLLGRKIRTLVDDVQDSDSYTIPFSRQNLSSGIYLIHMQAGDFVMTKKMTLIK